MGFLGSDREFLSTDDLVGTLSYFLPRLESVPLKAFLPLDPIDADKVRMDVAKADSGGMTPATVAGAESPLMDKEIGGGSVFFEAQEWREKVRVNASDTRSLRRFGTHDEKLDALSLIAKYQRKLRSRLETRLEWMRAKVLCDGALTFTPAHTNVPITINYKHPAFLEPTAAVAWSDTVNSTPIDDLVAWKELLDDFAIDEGALTVIINKTKERELRQNEQLAAFYDSVFKNVGPEGIEPVKRAQDASVSSKAVTRVLEWYVGDLGFVIHRGGADYRTDVVAAAAAAQPVLIVANVDEFNAGDIVYIGNRPQQEMQKRTILSVNIATRAITFTANLDLAVPVGARAWTRDHFVPDDCVLLTSGFDFRNLDSEEMDGQGFIGANNPILPVTIGTVASTRNQYLMDDDRPGFFSHLIEKNDDPPSIEIISGVMALPKIDYPELYVRATA